MENMSGAANGVFILPKPSPGSAKKTAVLGDKNGRLSGKKYTGKTPPLKPPKKHRSPDDDTEILRCKRRIQFPGRFPVQQRNPKQMAKRNERERNRVQTINSTFETLQAYLPPSYIQPKPKNKKMSKVEVLHAAINYIRNLQEVLSETDHLAAMHQHNPHLQHPGHMLGHNGQLMMVATSLPNNMLASTPNSGAQMDNVSAPLHVYPSPQTPSVMAVNATYYNPNDVPGPSMYSPDMLPQGPQVPSLAQPTQGLKVDTRSPHSSYSPNSVRSDAFDAPAATGTSTYTPMGGNVPTHSPTYGEAPLTPEDEDIIMEWLHDQKP